MCGCGCMQISSDATKALPTAWGWAGSPGRNNGRPGQKVIYKVREWARFSSKLPVQTLWGAVLFLFKILTW